MSGRHGRRRRCRSGRRRRFRSRDAGHAPGLGEPGAKRQPCAYDRLGQLFLRICRSIGLGVGIEHFKRFDEKFLVSSTCERLFVSIYYVFVNSGAVIAVLGRLRQEIDGIPPCSRRGGKLLPAVLLLAAAEAPVDGD